MARMGQGNAGFWTEKCLEDAKGGGFEQEVAEVTEICETREKRPGISPRRHGGTDEGGWGRRFYHGFLG